VAPAPRDRPRASAPRARRARSRADPGARLRARRGPLGRGGHERGRRPRGRAGAAALRRRQGRRRDGRPAPGAPPEAPGRGPGGAAAVSDEPEREELTYEKASARIEAIIRRLDSGEAGLRETLELVREGRRLIEFCAAELEAVGKGLEELELDQLVARLE